MQPIATEYGMRLVELNQVQGDVTKDMKMNKSQLHEKIQIHISKVESSHGVNIEVGRLSKLPKASVRNNNQIFLNFDHETFQSLVKNPDIPDEILNIYLLGIGLHLP